MTSPDPRAMMIQSDTEDADTSRDHPTTEIATPTPWRIHSLYPEEIYATVDGKRFMVADISGAGSTYQDRINAALIVAAVNNHPALNEALRRLAEEVSAIAPAVENLACHQEQCDHDGVMVKVSRQALDETLAAIDRMNSIAQAALRASSSEDSDDR